MGALFRDKWGSRAPLLTMCTMSTPVALADASSLIDMLFAPLHPAEPDAVEVGAGGRDDGMAID
jgi:hypothetical protein